VPRSRAAGIHFIAPTDVIVARGPASDNFDHDGEMRQRGGAQM
jgi:hypothetical protein